MTRQLPNKQMQQKYLRKENTIGLGFYNNKTSKNTGFYDIHDDLKKKFENLIQTWEGERSYFGQGPNTSDTLI